MNTNLFPGEGQGPGGEAVFFELKRSAARSWTPACAGERH